MRKVVFTLLLILPFVATAHAKHAENQPKPAGKIRIVTPADNAVVHNPVEVCFEAEGLEVNKAGKVNKKGQGHHHLLVDTHIPRNLDYKGGKSPKMIHLNEGQKCEKIKKRLSLGEHTIRGMFTQNDHTPYKPAVTDTIVIFIEGDSGK